MLSFQNFVFYVMILESMFFEVFKIDLGICFNFKNFKQLGVKFIRKN